MTKELATSQRPPRQPTPDHPAIVPSDCFKRNADGSWTTTKVCFVVNPSGGDIKLLPGITFRKGKGVQMMGFDLVEYLEQHSKDAVV